MKQYVTICHQAPTVSNKTPCPVNVNNPMADAVFKNAVEQLNNKLNLSLSGYSNISFAPLKAVQNKNEPHNSHFDGSFYITSKTGPSQVVPRTLYFNQPTCGITVIEGYLLNPGSGSITTYYPINLDGTIGSPKK